jgi:hypothetical protein
VDGQLQVRFEDIEDAEGVKPAVVKVSFQEVQNLVSQHDGEPLLDHHTGVFNNSNAGL